MQMSFDEIMEQARQLSREEKIVLAHTLLEAAFHGDEQTSDAELDAAWEDEVASVLDAMRGEQG